MPGVTRRTRANLMLLAAAAIWGLAFTAQVMGTAVGAFTFNAARFALGAASLLPLIVWQDRRAGVPRSAGIARWRSALIPGAICGGFLFIASSLQQIGMQWTTAGNAAFITSMYVVAVPVVGTVFGRRHPRTLWLGVALSVVGLYLLTMTGGPSAINIGDALNLASAVFWTGHILAVGRYAVRVDALRLAAVQFSANVVYAGVAAFLFEPAPFQGLDQVLAPVLYAGVISVGIGYTLQVLSQRDALESHAALIMSLEAAFGALGGALFLGERMTLVAMLGAVLMLAGILISQLPGPRSTPEQPGLIPVPEPPSTVLEDT